MKLSTYLVLAISYLGVASAASLPAAEELQSIEKRAGCFQSGVGYGNKDRALDAARSACSGPLQGYYQGGQSAVKCYNIGGNRSVKLTIQAMGGGTLSANQCYKGLGDRIRACPKGDEKIVYNWLYRADPNKGNC